MAGHHDIIVSVMGFGALVIGGMLVATLLVSNSGTPTAGSSERLIIGAPMILLALVVFFVAWIVMKFIIGSISHNY